MVQQVSAQNFVDLIFFFSCGGCIVRHDGVCFVLVIVYFEFYVPLQE